jgi:hypothetical protein
MSVSKRTPGWQNKTEMLNSRLAEASWRSHLAEESARAAVITAKAEAVEIHMVLRKAVAAHAAEVATEKRQKQEEDMKTWMANVKASWDTDVALRIQKYEIDLSRK